MIRNYLSLTCIVIIQLFFIACEKPNPIVPNEEELITTLTYTLTPTDGDTAVSLSFNDLDGTGGNNPVVMGGTLKANKTYTGTLNLLNESASPAESITDEIEEEKEEHQFFFQSNISNVNITYNDQDANGHPVGLSTTLTTGAASSGSITIILRHEPNKSGADVSGGDITNAGGETDIEVTFLIDVQ